MPTRNIIYLYVLEAYSASKTLFDIYKAANVAQFSEVRKRQFPSSGLYKFHSFSLLTVVALATDFHLPSYCNLKFNS